MPSSILIIAWHPGPYSQGTDAMMQYWNTGLPYAFLPFSMISRVLLKNKTGMCSSPDSESTSLEYPNMVPRILKPFCQGITAAAPGKINSEKPKKYCPSIDGGELIDASGLVGLRKTFLCEGSSENASDIIINSRREGTL